MSAHYILVGQTAVLIEPCDPYTLQGVEGLLEWGRWYEDPDNRRVEETFCWFRTCCVSTVFLGLDHSFRSCGTPILFETMAFWGPTGYDTHQERCTTWLEAEEMHRRVVRDCRSLKMLARGWWGSLRQFWRIVWRIEFCQWKRNQGCALSEMEELLDRMDRLAIFGRL